jgi:branched-subunit amino acid aminotransferase/4-amino-4-deoxychorismate lyase
MENNKELPGLADKIAARLAIKPQVFITHPAELRILRSITDRELRSFAARQGWRIVRRVGGRQIEFYNDAGARGTR